jgi:hypothetical protein
MKRPRLKAVDLLPGTPIKGYYIGPDVHKNPVYVASAFTFFSVFIAHFCVPGTQKPGFSLQFLGIAPQFLRYFRFNPLRPSGFPRLRRINFSQ